MSVKKDNHIEFSVNDDGVGMEQDVIEEILSPRPNPNRKKGIGIINTEQRLKRLYNKGLTIMSTPGVGTTITFTVPTNSTSKTI